jgi:hypothetical protein
MSLALSTVNLQRHKEERRTNWRRVRLCVIASRRHTPMQAAVPWKERIRIPVDKTFLRKEFARVLELIVSLFFLCIASSTLRRRIYLAKTCWRLASQGQSVIFVHVNPFCVKLCFDTHNKTKSTVLVITILTLGRWPDQFPAIGAFIVSKGSMQNMFGINLMRRASCQDKSMSLRTSQDILQFRCKIWAGYNRLRILFTLVAIVPLNT